MAGMPEALQKAFMQKLIGGTVTDVASNVLMTQYSEFGNTIDQGLANVFDKSKTPEQVTKEAIAQRENLNANMKAVDKVTGAVINLNDTMGASDGIIGESAKLRNELGLQTNIQKGATKQAIEDTDKAAANMAKLDVSVRSLDQKAQDLKAILTDKLTGPLGTYAAQMDTAWKQVEEFNVAMKKFNGQWGTGGGGGGGGGVPPPTAASRSDANQSVQKSSGGGIKGFLGRVGAGLAGEEMGVNELGQGSSNIAELIRFNGGLTGNRSNFDQLDASVKKRLTQMIQEYGKPVTFTSGARTANEQAQIKANGGIMAAAPGNSLHETGKAFDLNSGDVAALKSAGLLQKYGFQGLDGDSVHIQSAMANGGTLASGQTALVGEKGAELVHGPASVTGTASTSKIFGDMLDKLGEMVDVLKDNRDYSEKILHATQ
jgi:hypothetical protein